LEGPLDIEPGHHVEGVLAFFYEQHDDRPARVDWGEGQLVITDKLSDLSVAYKLVGGLLQTK
jgi:hypothetical protein